MLLEGSDEALGDTVGFGLADEGEAGHHTEERELVLEVLGHEIVFGRIYQDIEEVRTAVRGYFERYNQHWLLEKNGYRSPAETRRNWMAATITAQEAA